MRTFCWILLSFPKHGSAVRSNHHCIPLSHGESPVARPLDQSLAPLDQWQTGPVPLSPCRKRRVRSLYTNWQILKPPWTGFNYPSFSLVHHNRVSPVFTFSKYLVIPFRHGLGRLPQHHFKFKNFHHQRILPPLLLLPGMGMDPTWYPAIWHLVQGSTSHPPN